MHYRVRKGFSTDQILGFKKIPRGSDAKKAIMKKSKDLEPGDPINHKSTSLGYCVDAVIIDHYLNNNKDIWYVSYTNDKGKKVKGCWAKNQCVHRPIHVTAANVSIGSNEWFDSLKNVKEETHDDKLDSLAMGTMAHTLIEDDIARKFKIGLHIYKQSKKLENIMKAEIQEVFINGNLVDTFVNDKNVKDMGPSDFLCQIGNAEEAIKKLSKHEGKSIFAVQEVKRLTAFVTSQYVLLDKMHAEDATPKK